MSGTNLSDPSQPALFSSAPSAAMSAALAQNWWAVAIRGVLGILFGLIALFMPAVTLLSLVLVFAAYVFADGVFAIVAAVRAAARHERWALLMVEGIVNIAAAVIAVLWPAITVLAFVLLVAVWALLSGGLMLSAAFRLHADHGRWWLGIAGAVSIIYGIVLIVSPLVGAVVLTWWIGTYALVFGVALLILSLRLRAQRT